METETPNMSSETKQLIFRELDQKARVLVMKIPTIPPKELANWMYAQAQFDIRPYEQQGANRNLLMFHYGMLVSTHLNSEKLL